MLQYFILFSLQFLFNILKTFEIKFTYENKVKLLLWNSFFINTINIGTLYVSLDSLFQGDFLVLPFYLGGSILGKWVAMSRLENYRSLLFQFFNSTQPKNNSRMDNGKIS